MLGDMLSRLETEGLMGRINIIITSDHGMAPIKDRIAVDPIVDPDLYQGFGSGGQAMWQILPKEGMLFKLV